MQLQLVVFALKILERLFLGGKRFLGGGEVNLVVIKTYKYFFVSWLAYITSFMVEHNTSRDCEIKQLVILLKLCTLLIASL